MNLNERKNYNAIDAMRIVMALLVLILHKPFIPETLQLTKYFIEKVLTGIAVPFFFIVSSFFFFGKLDGTAADNKKFWKFEKRMLILYVVWTVVYIPINLIKFNGGTFRGMTLSVFASAMLDILKQFLLSRSFVHLWYIYTLIVSVAVIFLLKKFLSNKAILALSFVCFAASSLLPCLYPYIPHLETAYALLPGVLTRTLQKGLLCTSLGLVFSHFDTKGKLPALGGGLAIALAALLTFSAVTYGKSNTFVETVQLFLTFACSACTFLLCREIKLKDSPVYPTVRKYSSLIYFTHLLFTAELYDTIANATGIAAFSGSTFCVFAFTLLGSFILATIIIHLSNKRGFKWLKYIY